jgi:hypothetical protein
MIDLPLLLEEMAGWHDGDEMVGSQTVSWKAYRTAEKLDQTSLVPQLTAIIDETSKTNLKKHGYEVLTYILKNTKNTELANLLVSKLNAEDKNDDALYSLLIGLFESEVELNYHIDKVIFYVDDPRELIRNAAIRLLSRYSEKKDEASKALREVIESHYDEYDLKYAKESLALLKK